MVLDELAIIGRLQHSALSRRELEEIYEAHNRNTRILCHLVQHPRFPVDVSLHILPGLLPAHLMQVIRSMRANPFVRRQARLEFMQRYARMPAGQKVELLKMAPTDLLTELSAESHPLVLAAVLRNPHCTEEVVVRFLQREGDHTALYVELDQTEWHRNRTVAQVVARDREAPIRMLNKVVPFLELAVLQELFCCADTHASVRDHIRAFLETKKS